MLRLKRILAILAIAITFLAPLPAKAYDAYYSKIALGSPFTYFDLEDIYGQRWVSTFLRGKPVIILTAHRYQRYELLKWAESFRQAYMIPGKAYVLWVVNLRKVSWNTSRQVIYDQWRGFNASVPVLLDWDGVIGKSLRVNYNVPNIIVIDSYGRLVMHEMHSYNPSVFKAVSNKINPYCSNRKLRRGRRGDSN
ncbi:MAG: hypothetical protein II567_03245 [Candidatus Riflebacteria bacterium]|nr:hypothetical protein [Candidatus Riflebacteria bacterium]